MKLIKFCFVCLFLINSVLFASSNTNKYSVQTYYSLASEAFEKYDWKKVIGYCLEIIKNYPESSFTKESLFYLGVAYFNLRDNEASNKYFTKYLKSRSAFLLVAQAQDKIVGYILIKLEKFSWRAFNPIADVSNLSVDPMYRGRGIGTKLFQRAKILAKKRGVTRMSVQALTDNIRAIKFYQTQGFKDFDVILLLNID